MMINNTVYDILKWTGRVCLPALAALWVAIAKAWGIPYTTEISTTIMAIDLCLNTLLGIASENYNKQSANEIGGQE